MECCSYRERKTRRHACNELHGPTKIFSPMQFWRSAESWSGTGKAIGVIAAISESGRRTRRRITLRREVGTGIDVANKPNALLRRHRAPYYSRGVRSKK